jgi:hypothetical protein
VEEFLTKLAEQASAIKAAPYPFLLAIAVVGGAIWFVVNYLYSERISSKDAQLQLADRQIADYKQKLSGASPDEAKAKIDALERRILQLEPRRITPQQRQTFVETVRAPDKTHRIMVQHESGCPDCPLYAAAFERALRDAGWNVENGVVMGPAQRPARGIGLMVVDPLSPDPVLLQRAFRSAQIDIEIMKMDPSPMAIIAPAANVVLFITARPIE